MYAEFPENNVCMQSLQRITYCKYCRRTRQQACYDVRYQESAGLVGHMCVSQITVENAVSFFPAVSCKRL